VRLDVDYHSFPSDNEEMKHIADPHGVLPDLSISGGNFSIVDVTINAVGKLPTKSIVTPYGVIGMGMHLGSWSDLTLSALGRTRTEHVDGESDFGLNFGSGLEFRLGTTKLFIETQYVVIFAAGGASGFVPLNVGVVF
jgi:opacity protein-like surface antigen